MSTCIPTTRWSRCALAALLFVGCSKKGSEHERAEQSFPSASAADPDGIAKNGNWPPDIHLLPEDSVSRGACPDEHEVGWEPYMDGETLATFGVTSTTEVDGQTRQEVYRCQSGEVRSGRRRSTPRRRE